MGIVLLLFLHKAVESGLLRLIFSQVASFLNAHRRNLMFLFSSQLYTEIVDCAVLKRSS